MKKSALVYVVQDLEGHICGVFDTLEKAAPTFRDEYEDGVQMMEECLEDDFDTEDPFRDCDTAPSIHVWTVNDGIRYMYETPAEVQEALTEGEVYD